MSTNYMDFETMTLEEIEGALGIEKVNKNLSTFKECDDPHIFENWYQVQSTIKEFNRGTDVILDGQVFKARKYEVIGYEILENDYIKIYYNMHIDNSPFSKAEDYIQHLKRMSKEERIRIVDYINSIFCVVCGAPDTGLLGCECANGEEM